MLPYQFGMVIIHKIECSGKYKEENHHHLSPPAAHHEPNKHKGEDYPERTSSLHTASEEKYGRKDSDHKTRDYYVYSKFHPVFIETDDGYQRSKYNSDYDHYYLGNVIHHYEIPG